MYCIIYLALFSESDEMFSFLILEVIVWIGITNALDTSVQQKHCGFATLSSPLLQKDQKQKSEDCLPVTLYIITETAVTLQEGSAVHAKTSRAFLGGDILLTIAFVFLF